MGIYAIFPYYELKCFVLFHFNFTKMAWKPQDLQIGKVFDSDGVITNLDFHKDGKYLVASSIQDSIQVFDSLSATEWKKLYVKSTGVGDLKFTHHDNYVIFSSEKGSKDINYHCLYDNKYVHHFRRHNASITSISMSPVDDNFVSTSSDNVVYLWNLGVPAPIAKIEIPSQYASPFAAYDVSGFIFGVLTQNMRNGNHSLRLYDARKYERGPFQDVAPKHAQVEASLQNQGLGSDQIQRLLTTSWTSFQFSPDGHKIVVNTKAEMMLVLDSFVVGEPTAICSRKNDSNAKLGACVSADSQCILSGNEDNEILIYDITSGKLQNTLTGHVGPVGSIICNPRYDVVAAGCTNTALWTHESY